MNIKDTLFKLANSCGNDSPEYTALNMLKNYTQDCYIRNGNVIGNFGKRTPDKPHLLIDAHIDQIGFICTSVTDDGFIKFSSLGGIDKRILPAQQVIIHGKQDITGIISAIPPHLSKSKDNVTEIENMCIDTGFSKEQLEEIVSLGDIISFAAEAASLSGDKVTGKSLDDRCGVTAILYMLEMLSGEELPCSLSVMFSAQEELGERGAVIGAYDINPDIALAVDVSFALTSDEKTIKCGELGKGAMIGISPSLSREISFMLKDIAIKNDIPYQFEVMNGTTGTNADRFSVTRGGVKTCTVSIPLRYMHTPVEVIDLNDIKNTALLLAEFVRRCGK